MLKKHHEKFKTLNLKNLKPRSTLATVRLLSCRKNAQGGGASKSFLISFHFKCALRVDHAGITAKVCSPVVFQYIFSLLLVYPSSAPLQPLYGNHGPKCTKDSQPAKILEKSIQAPFQIDHRGNSTKNRLLLSTHSSIIYNVYKNDAYGFTQIVHAQYTYCQPDL